MNHKSLFFKYVIPSIIAFALSGIYAIVDGYFVGNTIGDAGLSAINIAYPIVALIQALGTGIGMGGAVYYSINAAEKKGKRAEEFIATSWWLLVIVSVISTIIIYSFSSKILGLLGADGIILTNATDYIKIIALGAILQILGTGMMPFIRNYGNSFWSMFAMVGGFITTATRERLNPRCASRGFRLRSAAGPLWHHRYAGSQDSRGTAGRHPGSHIRR